MYLRYSVGQVGSTWLFFTFYIWGAVFQHPQLAALRLIARCQWRYVRVPSTRAGRCDWQPRPRTEAAPECRWRARGGCRPPDRWTRMSASCRGCLRASSLTRRCWRCQRRAGGAPTRRDHTTTIHRLPPIQPAICRGGSRISDSRIKLYASITGNWEPTNETRGRWRNSVIFMSNHNFVYFHPKWKVHNVNK